jgi:hypothetical protein
MGMIEAFCVPDTFISGLGTIEEVGGGCFRFTFFACQTVAGREERIVVAKLIAPLEVVPPAVLMAAKAVGMAYSPEWLKLH